VVVKVKPTRVRSRRARRSSADSLRHSIAIT
jgi:hypothetical protein